MKTVKSSKIPYFFISIVTLGFGVVWILSFVFLPGKLRMFGGEWVDATYLNSLPFLILGLISMMLLISNLIYTYWMTANQDGLIVRNPFKRKKIHWHEVKDISPPTWINFPISKVNTRNKKSYYIHFPAERLNQLFNKNK